MDLLVVNIILYTVMAVVSAAGIALFVIITLLDRSNNMGDTCGRFDDYSPHAIFLDTGSDRNDIGMEEGRRYLMNYGDNPFDMDGSEAPEMLRRNDDDIYGELEEVDIPLFKPLNG